MQRRTALAQEIVKNPKRALELAASPRLRLVMPPSVREQLEDVFTDTGVFTEVIPNDPTLFSKDYKPVYQATIGTRVMNANFFGATRPMRTVERIPLHGIAIDGEIAIAEKPARLMDPEEVAANPKLLVQAKLARCPVSGNLLTRVGLCGCGAR